MFMSNPINDTPDEEHTLVSSYTLDQAMADGVLKPVFSNRWPSLTWGKPIVATAAIYEELSAAALIEIWNAFAVWRHEIRPTLAEEDQMYTTTMNGKTVWVIEDGQAFTILYPEEY